ncbi:pilin [Patescibacteria group bacterium]|nr:pilin [Patescibacteria group bacterium]
MNKFLIFLIIFGIFLVVVPVLADDSCEPGLVCIPNPLKAGDIPELIHDITGIIQIVVIPLGIIMIMIGGFQYMTSTGNEEKVTKAKKTIMWAIIGVVIAIAANFITGILEEIIGKINN